LKKLLIIIFVLFTAFSCRKSGNEPAIASVVITSDVITSSYIGNGVQWGGYDILEQWTGSATLSDADWNKLFKRVEYLRPPIVRIMVADGWNYLTDGVFDPEKSNAILVKILDFCEDQGISVIIGEWGHKGGSTVDQTWLENSASFLQWLLVTKNYTCIKYFNMVNEPNGSWSTIGGDYDLWKSLITQFSSKLINKGLESKIKITGPDIAVWNTASTYWITDTYYDLGSCLGAYDIHTYPTETEVRNGDFFDMIKAYKDEVPESKEMFMGEFGFKYASTSSLGIENESRENSDAYSSDDCNMMVYDAFYGVDVADAIMQNMNAGYSGLILWDMDDAMYNADGGSSTLLKRWGFWNILGEEKFENAADENIRPWFYPVSLMSRYFPAGSTIFAMSLPDKKGLRAIAARKDDKYSIAIVNSNYVDYTIRLSMENGIRMTGIKSFSYISGEGSDFTALTDTDGFASPFESDRELNLSNGNEIELNLTSQSFLLFTNME
jgi:hypothetical protein